MRPTIHSAALLVTLAALTGPDPTRGADDFKLEAGFKSLFNGKDLGGWQTAGSKEALDGKTEAHNKRFVVRDGEHTGNLPGKLLRNL